MAHNIVVHAELSCTSVTIIGLPLKYSWNEHARHCGSKRKIRAVAQIDPSDLTSIYLVKDKFYVRLDAKRRPSAESCKMLMQENFWGGLCLKLYRTAKNSERFNKDQAWIRGIIPRQSKFILIKDPVVGA